MRGTTEGEKNGEGHKQGSSFRIAAIALMFMAIGYQTALFVRQAAITRIISEEPCRDTVYVFVRDSSSVPVGCAIADHAVHRSKPPRDSVRREAVAAVIERYAPRRVESFRFDPNTVSVEDLRRLGFSAKQAQSIVNYREKGGHFRRKADFAKSYVVADSVYERLAPYIDIPLLDINKADSAAFDALPGIGPYFASRMVEYRSELGRYTSVEQLLDIWKFDIDRLDAIRDLICVSDDE